MAAKGMRTANQLAEAIVRRLEGRKQTVTFAESCTGGMVASTLVGVSGASHVFQEGYVTYCDASKHNLLGVSEETLACHTAVSTDTAYEMVRGALERADADYAVAITGYADGEEAYAGLVYIACARKEVDPSKEPQTWVTIREHRFTGGRNDVRKKATYQALKLLWEMIEDQ